MRQLLLLFCVFLGMNLTFAQCDGGNSAGSLSPIAGYQTTSFNSGDYFTINVQCGYQYYFSTSYNGGDAGGNDTQITINLTDGTTDVAFDDDSGDGWESDLTWTSDFTGTIQVLITEYNCVFSGAISGTLAYNQTAGTPNTDFSLYSTSCSTASATITGDTGGTFAFNPSPGDGATINTSTGAISNGIAGATYSVEYTVCSSSSIETVTMPGTNNAFDYSLTLCDEATPVQTAGESGGAFSFTSNPGGGTQIDSNSGIITNADPGDTYSIDYDVCGITTTFNYTFPTNLSDFNMIEVCGGGVPDIIGAEGGTFSFSPDPSDGSQISSTTGVVSNGVVGETYTIEYDVCGSTSTSSLFITSDNCFTLNGDAQQLTVNGESCIQLTDAQNNQTGCAWNGSTIDFASDFTLSLDYYFGSNVNGADGNTFTFQPSSSTACGNNGGQLGAGGLNNALSIEFDTYDNDNPSHIYDRLCDHVAIEVDGDHQNGVPAAGPECAKPDGGNIDDGEVYTVDIDWNATTQTLSVYFDGNLVLTYTENVVANVFGGVSEVYWGATSATGGLNNQQYFCPSTIVILDSEIIHLNGSCENNTSVLSWEVSDESAIRNYTIEYSMDGYVYQPYKTVYSNNQSILSNYSEEIRDIPQKSIVRLKIEDLDGTISHTDPIYWAGCEENQMNDISIIQQNQLVIKDKNNDQFTVHLIDARGSLIAESCTKNGCVIFPESLTQGVYILSIQYLDGTYLNKKVFIQ